MPAAGTVLAERYVLGALIGQGATGLVYAALDRKLQREVAIKLRHTAPSMRVSDDEALAAGVLQHPNVLAVFDAGEEQGVSFLVTELLRGESLRALLSRGPLPHEQVRPLAQQIAAGLASAHAKGFTHRDLSPSSIFITTDGWVKILDFGFGKPGGTAGYRAPEQVRGQPVDARADLFNFGLVLYEMLRGQRAFPGETPQLANQAIVDAQPAPLPGETPRALRRLVERCLAKDRTERPPSAQELLIGLQQPHEEIRRKPAVRRRKLWPAAAVAALTAAAAAAIFVFAPRRTELPAPRGPAAPPNGTVAILPFDAAGAPNFALLAEGVGDVLSRDFEGGSLRSVDTTSVLHAIGTGSPGDLDRASAAAAQLGAKYFILGRLTEKSGQLHLMAVLYDSSSGEPLLMGGAHGNPDEVLRPIRVLSDQLQGRDPSGPEFEERLKSLAWRTSSSPVALQAWIEGEHLSRRGIWDKAALPYQRAVAADPQFALAHYRLGRAMYWDRPGMAQDELELALRHSDHLSKPERLAVEGHLYLQRGSFDRAEEIFIEATRKYPAEPQAWIELGELYFDNGPRLGRSPQDALPALQQALMFEPVNTNALVPLIDLAILRNERGTVLKLTDRLLGQTDNPTDLASYGLVRAWARKDTAERARILTGLHRPGAPPLPRAFAPDALPRVLPEGEQKAEAAVFTFVRSEWLADNAADIEDLARALVPSSTSFMALAEFDLRRGRPQAARRAFAEAKELSDENTFYASWMNTFPDFEIGKEELAAARASAAALERGVKNPEQLPAKRYVAGLLDVRAHDLAAATKVAESLETMPKLFESSLTTDLALALRARIESDKGNYAAALALIERQQLRIPMRYARFYYWASETFLRASLLQKAKRYPEALRLYDALIFYRNASPGFMPLSHLYKARIYEEMGNPEAAFENYKIFVEAWKGCEQAERPLLIQAQKRMAQLPGHRADK